MATGRLPNLTTILNFGWTIILDEIDFDGSIDVIHPRIFFELLNHRAYLPSLWSIRFRRDEAQPPRWYEYCQFPLGWTQDLGLRAYVYQVFGWKIGCLTHRDIIGYPPLPNMRDWPPRMWED
tara:strand:+ start:730 stop:1095 length:366 start_codon:yes stop_codon:yes gene_type:complete